MNVISEPLAWIKYINGNVSFLVLWKIDGKAIKRLKKIRNRLGVYRAYLNRIIVGADLVENRSQTQSYGDVHEEAHPIVSQVAVHVHE